MSITTRFSKSRWAPALGVLGCLILGLPSPRTALALVTVPDAYFTRSGPESVSIALDRIGILAREGVRADSITALARSFGFINPVRWNTFIWTFDLTRPLQRRDLAGLARQVKANHPTLVAEAGMTVTAGRGTTPAIVTDKFIAQFRPSTTPAEIDSFNLNRGVEVIESSPKRPNHYLLRITAQSGRDALEMANLYHQDQRIRYAHPNFIRVLKYRFLPNDKRFDRQWHLRNTGQNAGSPETGGTVGADIDAPEAWDIVRRSMGSTTIPIAVIDGGFDLTHPDLLPNLWTNTREAEPEFKDNCLDDDGNGVPDDIHGYDFFPCDAETGTCDGACGDGDPSYNPSAPVGTDEYLDDLHGTPVAGLIGAVANNNLGVAGVCPNARLILVRRGFDDEHLAQAFDYCVNSGAKVINCSWGIKGDGFPTPNLDEAIDRAVLSGVVVLFAMDYVRSSSDCTRDGTSDLAEHDNVIAVSASTNQDRFNSQAACGDYVDVLAPSNRGTDDFGAQFEGTLNIATTDIVGDAGYNKVDAVALSGCPSGTEATNVVSTPEDHPVDYTYCFTGTSAATPIAAGVVGMILTVNPGLTPDAVQRLLQDAADKIEPTVASYDASTGFSHPPSTPSTHGYGRVNAFEAVRVAAAVDVGGRGGTDLYVRDNELDWGNTERPSSVTLGPTRGFEAYWNSMDIKVDAPDFQLTTTPTSRAFDEILTDEEPIGNVVNRVYVRVRNRGPQAAQNVTVKLLWAEMGTEMPKLPPDFWTGFATGTFDQTDWHSVPVLAAGAPLSIANSGSTAVCKTRALGTTASEEAGIYTFEWTPPEPTPDQSNHYCLLAVADAAGDATGAGADHPGPYQKVILTPPTPLVDADFDVDALTPSDNNVTQRNYFVSDTSDTTEFAERIYIRNSSPVAREFQLRAKLPPQWQVRYVPARRNGPRFRLGPGERKLVHVIVTTPHRGAAGDVSLFQEDVPKKHASKPAPPVVRGGATFRYRPNPVQRIH